jgi:hypothetical protein
MAILDLNSHPFVWVTVRELADYWRVSPACVVSQITSGDIEAIQIRPGTYRVRSTVAIAFEQRGRVGAAAFWPTAVYSASAECGTVKTPEMPARWARPERVSGGQIDE